MKLLVVKGLAKEKRHVRDFDEAILDNIIKNKNHFTRSITKNYQYPRNALEINSLEIRV